LSKSFLLSITILITVVLFAFYLLFGVVDDILVKHEVDGRIYEWEKLGSWEKVDLVDLLLGWEFSIVSLLFLFNQLNFI
jgi:hypothetical protein